MGYKSDPLDESLGKLRKLRMSKESKKDIHAFIMNYYDQEKSQQKAKRKWIGKMSAGMGSIAVLLLVAVISTGFIHQHTLDQSGKTPSILHKTHIPSNVSKTTYSLESKATVAFNNIILDFGKDSLRQSTNIGLGINADYKSGAGNYEFKWTQRQWTVLFKGNGNLQSGRELAKKMARFLQKTPLPTPAKTGVISLSKPMSPTVQNNVIIAWQKGKSVYSVKQTDPTVQGLQTLIDSSNSPKTQKTFKNMTAQQLSDYFIRNGKTLPFSGTDVTRISPNQFTQNLTYTQKIQPDGIAFSPNAYQVMDEWKGYLNNKPFILEIYQNTHSKNQIIGLVYNHKVQVAYSCQSKGCIIRNFTGNYVSFAAPNLSGKYFSVNLLTGRVILSSQRNLNLELAGINLKDGSYGVNWITGLSKKYPFKQHVNQSLN